MTPGLHDRPSSLGWLLVCDESTTTCWSACSILETRRGVSVSTLLFVFGPVHATYLYTLASQGYVSAALQLLSMFFGVGLLFAWIRIRTRNIVIPACWTSRFPYKVAETLWRRLDLEY